MSAEVEMPVGGPDILAWARPPDELDPARTGVDHGQSLALLSQQTDILQMLAAGADLPDVLTAVTLALESHMPGTRCSVLLYDPRAHRMRHGAAPSLPAAYNTAIDGLAVGPRAGSCGTAAHLGRQVVVFDIPTDPRWAEYRDLAAEHNLRACWSSPILGSDGEVLGTFAVYHENPHTPTRRESRLVDRYRDLAAVAISHNRVWGALAASEEQFRRIFADSAVGMALLDLHGRFTRVNRAFCGLLARPETDLVGRHFAEITHPDDIARSVTSWAAMAAGEVASGHQEKRYLRCDGRAVWVEMVASVVRGRDGIPLHISTNVVDLTARKVAEAERQARHAAEVARGSAETASRAKSEFLSTMSHELRTPLSAIVGFTELLDTLDLSGERRTTALGHIGRAARHIIAILDDVLDLAKIEAGVVSIDRCPVRVAPVVHATCELLEPLADRRGLSVDLSGADQTVAVLADPRRLEQALLNVVSNAIKYNRPAGELHISCGPAPAAPNRARITVRDTGLGIAPELQHRLFTPFDRLDAELHGEPGAGLGLVVTERLVAAMGGQLALHSEPGVGTVVEIDLDAWNGPLDATVAVKPAPSGRRRVLATGSVLYVEDDPAHRELVAEVLRARPGIRLCTCGGGGEALDALRADPPDLLLLDLDLPDLPGEAVLAAVAADPKLSGVPVCVLSGRLPDTRGVPEPAARLTKPLVPGDLLGVLDELLAPGDRTAR
ncbi:MAG TPA: ATP-binding protein [Sporichthyaceae bacterium]|jgi:PAS domain S-box-containing protein|nr:ATP-binding protein [Sporichthyaceae bacterium]